tara:strand:+ start:55 stop:312 length:258 start_codon:yes stop_codon:yes gene_type:complete
MKKWRSGAKSTLWARPIKESEWPKLVQAMMDDGLYGVIMSDGLTFYHGAYEVKRKSIQKVWGLSDHQMRRFLDHILVTDLFIKVD